ncbi:MAG: DUF1700 domain-containing protein [Clostridia bacterium]|nr:DUF1700 domain-containing protein [Clostridia bacterium]
MTKEQFLQSLAHGIAGLPEVDVIHWLEYYGEMLDDRAEDGMSEEEAVAALGDPVQIARQILAETPITRLIKERIKPKQTLPVWVIILLILGSPIWLSLAISAVAVVFSVIISLWACMLAFYAVELSFAVSTLGCLVLCAVEFYFAAPVLGLLFLGCALAMAGLSIITFPLWKLLTRLMIKGSKLFWLFIKKLFVRKEKVQ